MKILSICCEETLENVRVNIGGAFIWVAVDETTDFVGCFIANLVGGKLYIEVSSNPYLICSIPLLQHLKCCCLPEFTRRMC
jgi:hypothetical protein